MPTPHRYAQHAVRTSSTGRQTRLQGESNLMGTGRLRTIIGIRSCTNAQGRWTARAVVRRILCRGAPDLLRRWGDNFGAPTTILISTWVLNDVERYDPERFRHGNYGTNNKELNRRATAATTVTAAGPTNLQQRQQQRQQRLQL